MCGTGTRTMYIHRTTGRAWKKSSAHKRHEKRESKSYEKYENSLKKGAKIELEHNRGWKAAVKTAKDHLKENKDYYKYAGGKGKEYLITRKH